ncbi:MAG: DUF4292 domain-containing protein [Microscillaceae bacterium]|nr:DUF4292 domain-containing protein [Microscillaceae bacterium]MDW8460633.1 DUF4292 domain-containing protein [Cytophagales bacterium]
MNNTNLPKTWLLVLALFAVGIACKRKITNPTQLQEMQTKWLEQKDTPYNYLDLRFKLHYQSEDEDQKAKIKLRMRKDSLIWVSITAPAGVEILRALITTDTAHVINRLQKEYLKLDFEQLSKKLNFKVDFNLLQSIIMGTMPFRNYDKAKQTRNNNHIIVKQKVKHIWIDNYLNVHNEQLERLFMKDSLTQNSVMLIYENFMNYGNVLFANNRKITVNYKEKNKQKKTDILIDHIKVDLTNKPLEFPFKVPKYFEQEDEPTIKEKD